MTHNNESPGRGGTGRRVPGRTRFAAMAGATLAAVLLAAGCSSSSTSSASAPASSAPASTSAPAATSAAASQSASTAPTGTVPASDVGITASTIKVGVIADVNNPLVPGLFKDSVNAVKAWASEVNAAGGLDGRQVAVDFCDGFYKGGTASPISKMLSSTTQTPTGRLAMPKTRRVDVLSAPNTLTSKSDAASATLGCSRNSGVVTSDTPRRTTRVTLSSDPKCSLASARAFNPARRVARRPSSMLNSAPMRPKNLGAPPSTGSVPLKKSKFPACTAST